MFFSRGRQNDFSRGRPKVVKFHITHSKPRKQGFCAKMLIRKCQISKSREAMLPLCSLFRCPRPRDVFILGDDMFGGSKHCLIIVMN